MINTIIHKTQKKIQPNLLKEYKILLSYMLYIS